MDTNFGMAYMQPQEAMSRIALQNQQIARFQQERALFPLKLQDLQTLGRMNAMKLAQAQRMEQALSQMQGNGQGPQSPVDVLGKLAGAAAQAGNPTMASNLWGKQMELLSRQATAAKAQAQTQKDNVNFVEELMGQVHDQQSLDYANALWQQTLGTQSPLAGQRYSPELVSRWQDQLLAGKGKMTMQERLTALQANIAQKKAAMEYMAARMAHLKVQEGQQAERLRKSEKVGGVGMPTKTLIDQSTLHVMSTYKNLPADESTQAGFTVASRAMQLRKANPALSADEAIQQALQDVKGDFEEADRLYGLSSETKYTDKPLPPVGKNGPGSSPTTPLGLPKDPSATNLKKGAWYKMPDGSVQQWSGE